MMVFKTITFLIGMFILGGASAYGAYAVTKSVDWDESEGMPALFVVIALCCFSAACFVCLLVRFYTATS